jgi:hypothetical protein
MAISATISAPGSVTATSDPSGKKEVTAVTIPGPKGDSGLIIAAATLEIGNLANTDVSGIADGSMLMYSTSSSKWEAKNDLDTGTIILNGGNF